MHLSMVFAYLSLFALISLYILIWTSERYHMMTDGSIYDRNDIKIFNNNNNIEKQQTQQRDIEKSIILRRMIEHEKKEKNKLTHGKISADIYRVLEDESPLRYDQITDEMQKFWDWITTVTTQSKGSFGEFNYFNRMDEKVDKWRLIDIGSNVGAFTFSFIKQMNQAKLFDKFNNKLCFEVIGFEPIPTYAKTSHYFLKHYLNDENNWSKNINIDKQLNITVINSGIGASIENPIESKQIWFDVNNFGWNTFVESKANKNEMKALNVVLINFDWFYETYLKDEPIDILKIDVEGFEYQVLQCMHKTLLTLKEKRMLPILNIEVAWGQQHPNWKQEIKEFDFLFNEIGYIKQPNIYTIKKTDDFVLFPDPQYSTRLFISSLQVES